MKSTRAKAYINESLTIEFSGAFGVPQEDAIRAVEIAESDHAGRTMRPIPERSSVP